MLGLLVCSPVCLLSLLEAQGLGEWFSKCNNSPAKQLVADGSGWVRCGTIDYGLRLGYSIHS